MSSAQVRWPSLLAIAAAVSALVAGVANGLRFHGYVCDDAVISFRSVQNFGLGHGWVYNVGERVETFTNLGFVWLLSLAQALGVDVFTAAAWIGQAAFAGALAATWLLARELLPRRVAWAPVLVVATSTTLAGQAGTGLETTTCALLLTLGLWRLLAEHRALLDGGRARHGLGLLLLGLAAVVRIDAVLVLVGGFVLKRAAGRSWRAPGFAADLAALLASLGLPSAFRWFYYGDPVPNPVRAKAAVEFDPRVYEAGADYVVDWLRADFGPAVLFGGLALALWPRRSNRMLVVLAAGWLCYVVASGGDHMPYHRFVAPMLPAFAVAVLLGWHRLADRAGLLGTRAGAAVAVLFVLAVAAEPLALSLSQGNLPARNQPSECYRAEVGRMFAEQARRRGGPMVVAGGAAGYMGFHAGPQVRFVDMLGLTDAHVAAHGRRDRRMPAGHQAGDGIYVLDQEPVYVVFGSATPNDLWQRPGSADLLDRILADGVETWERANGHLFSVSERELLHDPRFARDYELVAEPLESGRTFRVCRRR